MSTPDLKTCNHCQVPKATKNFTTNTKKPDGLSPTCNLCHKPYFDAYRLRNKRAIKSRYLMKTYGIDMDHYDQLLAAQEGVCAICGAEEDDMGRALAVDHNHSTGEVRGLLCTACNQAVGRFGDSAERFRRAAEYLEARPSPSSSGSS